MSEPNQILEIDKLQSDKVKKPKKQSDKPKSGKAPRPRPSGLG